MQIKHKRVSIEYYTGKQQSMDTTTWVNQRAQVNHSSSIRCMFSVLFRKEMRAKLWRTVLFAHSDRPQAVKLQCPVACNSGKNFPLLRSCIQQHKMDSTKAIIRLIIGRQRWIFTSTITWVSNNQICDFPFSKYPVLLPSQRSYWPGSSTSETTNRSQISTAVSRPPVDTSTRSSQVHRTLVTCEEWPLYCRPRAPRCYKKQRWNYWKENDLLKEATLPQ